MITHRVHPGYLDALAVTVVGVIVGAAVFTQVHALDQRKADHMRTVGRQLPDPAGMTLLSRGECPSQENLVRCMRSDRDPDQLARHYQEALTRTGGEPARLVCDTLPAGLKPRDCLVRIDDGDHTVLVGVRSDIREVEGRRILSGSGVRIDAS